MDGLDEDRALVAELVRWSGHKVARIAANAGMANTTLNRHYNGSATTRLSQPIIDKLKAAYPRFPRWAGEELAELDYVSVNVLPSYAGMGGGGTGSGDIQTAKMPIRLIRDELRGRPQDFELIDVRGDSMAPDFLHGDQILIDRRDRDPRQPGPFALWDGDGYVVKLVERMPGKRGWYRVFSANERYSPYEVEEHEATILGRPVWFARRL
ncbi:helix-turn-helix transcriptional regulator [Rhizorhabdus sp.]|uniref:S24 family peptidase n=1 Tax=Rhizorhabdus sp. TaxID=1968843 RepID=UPI0035B3794F